MVKNILNRSKSTEVDTLKIVKRILLVKIVFF